MIVIGGPEGLSWRDVMALVGQALGRGLPVVFVQPGESVPLVPEMVAQLLALQNTYESVFPMDETAAAYDVEPGVVHSA